MLTKHGAEQSREHLLKLLDGSLNLLARDSQSVAKNFLWELEVLQALQMRHFNAVLNEPDVVSELDGFRIGIACKKTYSENGVGKVLSEGIKQLGSKFDIGIVAFNLDELIQDDEFLRTDTQEQASNVLAEFNRAFLQRHDKTFRKYLKDGRLTTAIVSIAAIAETSRETPRYKNMRQFIFWSFPDGSDQKNIALERFRQQFVPGSP